MTHTNEILQRLREFNKQAFQPTPPPMDPAMAGGAPPMDPAMAGGMPPMDPAMGGGAPPMDPAMGGGDPAGDPMSEMMMALQEIMTVVEEQNARIEQLEAALMGPQGMEPGMEQGMPPGMDQGMPPPGM